jgi:hypothetical protein
LQSISAVGEVLALTWALEIGEVSRFSSIGEACSYCGLTSAQHSSAGVEHDTLALAYHEVGQYDQAQSYPIQDEPEARMCFQYKMSLKGRGTGMLGIDHQHETSSSHKSGRYPGFPGGQRRNSI